MNKKSLLIVVLSLSALSFSAVRDQFGLNRNVEIMVNIMREISENYVDEVDPDQLLSYAAEGISRRMDPYTVYMPEEEMSSFELLTTGKYGGIGSLIRQDSDYVMIAQPYKGSPADKAGLIIGDRIVAIDKKDAKGKTTEWVSSNLKGTPDTDVTLTVRRLLTGKDEEVTIRRERIAIPGIPYYGFVGDKSRGVGYIQHSEFTEGVAKDMARAIEDMTSQGMTSLILDYRNNGGGVLQEAIDVVSLFTPKGTEVVTLKGRKDSVTYRTEKMPIAQNLPLVLLINENSASASEIVAGALQDLDRAVLVGAKSFGKGLVQSPRAVGYNSYLKLTTSKYYIPSGRCIQAIDYSNHDKMGDEKKMADSLRRAFKTKAGRTVYDGGGINPDDSLKSEYMSRFTATLVGMGFVDEYGNDYMRKHPTASDFDVVNFTITDQDYDDFKALIATKDIPYKSTTREVLKALKEAAIEDLYSDIAEDITEIEKSLKDDTESNLETYREGVIEAINSNIVLRRAYSEGVVERSIESDKAVARAQEILGDKALYSSILTPKEEE